MLHAHSDVTCKTDPGGRGEGCVCVGGGGGATSAVGIQNRGY